MRRALFNGHKRRWLLGRGEAVTTRTDGVWVRAVRLPEQQRHRLSLPSGAGLRQGREAVLVRIVHSDHLPQPRLVTGAGGDNGTGKT